jgi:alkaline phosphatase
MKRRDLLKLGAAVSAGAATGLVPSALHRAEAAPGRNLRARSIIFFAYDGTGYEDIATADFFARSLGRRSLQVHRLMSEGLSGSARPESLLSVVTDSAAATTAWATGRRNVNRELAQFPDGTPLTTILELARDRGMATGLATSARITHATPAGWAVHHPDRNAEEEIAVQLLAADVDVLLGGGRAAFEAEGRSDGRDLFAEFEAQGYSVLRTPEDLAGSNGSRLLGVFTDGEDHLPYEVDRRFQEVPAPSLADVAGKALEVLDGAENGFVLQIEAGRIDHANHQNDPGGMIWDWMAAEEALTLAMEYVDRNPDTLLVAMPDHDCGGGTTYGIGPWYLNSTESLETLHRRRASHEWLLRNVLAEETDPRAVADAVREFLGVPLAQPRAEAVIELLTGEDPENWPWGHPNAHGSQATAFGHLVSITDERAAVDRPNINFSTGAHTGGLVPVVLYGAGAAQGNLGVIDNYELFGVMTDALGIRFENPEMDAETARAIVENG